MNPFASLKTLLTWRTEAPKSPSAEWEPPLGLTPGEWKALKALRADEAYDVFLKALDKLCIFSGEALLGATGDESLHFHRGFISGVRKAALLIDELKVSEKEHENGRKRTERRERAGRISALYGSPGWSKPI